MQKNNQDTKEGGSNWFKRIMLLVLLVGLPAISWYYLSNGLNWRKEAVAELGSYGHIRGAFIMWPDGTKEDRLKSKVVVVHVFGENPDLTPENKKIIDTGEELFKQFGQSEHFRLAMVAEGGTAEFRSHMQTRPSIDYATWVWTGGLGSWRTIIDNGYQSFVAKTAAPPMTYHYALTDTSGMIRRYYNALDDQQVKRMVQQIALLLPK
ncbi:MAG TPA: hypothetical protein PKD78_03290 [Saprospiraceae bacterium]|nr:hypothetical protein [Saprospiraceae bacterium]